MSFVYKIKQSAQLSVSCRSRMLSSFAHQYERTHVWVFVFGRNFLLKKQEKRSTRSKNIYMSLHNTRRAKRLSILYKHVVNSVGFFGHLVDAYVHPADAPNEITSGEAIYSASTPSPRFGLCTPRS